MEGGEGTGFDSALMKKRRSSAARRPRPEGVPAGEQRDNTSSSTSMSSRSGLRRFLPADENASGRLRRRDFRLNAPTSEAAVGSSSRKSEDGNDPRLSSPADDKPRKLKVKIRSNVLAKPDPNSSDSRSLPAKPPRPGDSRHQQKHGNLPEGTKDSDRSTSSRNKKTREVKSIEEALTQEQQAKVQREPSSEPVRKSRRLAKKSILDNELDEENDTNKLENSITSEDIKGPENKGGSSSKKNGSKKVKSSKVNEADNDFLTSRSNRDGKKRSRESLDSDDSEEEPASESELDAEETQQQSANESPANVRSEPLTTRRRALQSWMDGSSVSTVEFPDGLPPAPSRSKKDKLSEEEVLAKKAEAAQRRKILVEKATKESEAEAIRKILGLDSEKKKEERKQREREEKERAARAQNIAATSVRWVMGPTGTIISFPEAVGLPSIFNSKPHRWSSNRLHSHLTNSPRTLPHGSSSMFEPCSYPPPREKCAGPSCTNPYRYRDSKLNLPLCSLKCYKAVHGNA